MPSFEQIVSVPALFNAWRAFSTGKKNKSDVAEYATRLMSHVHALHRDLVSETYRHGSYTHFRVNDSKPRDIHKASVRDRIAHHAIYQALYPYFDARFVHDSYSCRIGKGTHRALEQFACYARKAGHNHTRTVWVLKCDIRKCFASINHAILKELLKNHIDDVRLNGLLNEIIDSFSSSTSGAGIPLGNLTSQLFINIYLHELDQFVKHELRERFYIRYADDFVIFSQDRIHLEKLIEPIRLFLRRDLRLAIHEDRQFLKTIASGVDFLGWVHFSDHRVLRTSTKRRALRNCRGKETDDPTLQSYRGLFAHGNARKIEQKLYAAHVPC